MSDIGLNAPGNSGNFVVFVGIVVCCLVMMFGLEIPQCIDKKLL